MPHVGVVHVPQTVWLALRYFETSSFLYAVDDAENLNKNTVCSAILEVAHGLTGLAHSFVVFPTTCPTQTIKEGFYNIAGLFSGVLLGDMGYACQPFLMTLYPDPDEGPQTRFNVAHAKTRVKIEMTFGLLKARFTCLRGLRVAP
ncbi:hypothetical protein JOQ06_006621 [Pogonophryne albipinna]|uniref:DDE Tnp4 domain-containing protein n=1 Tax=Pogonophryne albipinna TaxID=1090488 RepID=A0AAD6AZ85_9TELE|nr:hypothetical protein JOQ06_006621 [Pogonophryne albipinna]